MGMEATYRAISPAGFAELLADPEKANSFFNPLRDPNENLEQMSEREQQQEEAGQFFDLYKEWHTLHYLLTGESSLEEPSRAPAPLGNAVRGGTPTSIYGVYGPIEAGCGPIRSLNPDEVRAVAEALHQIPVDELGRRFDAAATVLPHIYSQRWSEDEREWLLEVYARLIIFFNKAAEAGNMMLLSLG
jgi:uncharacterized protein DUF1877